MTKFSLVLLREMVLSSAGPRPYRGEPAYRLASLVVLEGEGAFQLAPSQVQWKSPMPLSAPLGLSSSFALGL